MSVLMKDRDRALRKDENIEIKVGDLDKLLDRTGDLIAENAKLRKVLDAVWEALDGLYGGDGNGEEIPINLLPEDRQQLFHRVLELFGDLEAASQ